MEYGLNRSATRFELSRHAEIAGTCLQQVGNQVCDLDCVMEFGHKQLFTNGKSAHNRLSSAMKRSIESD